MNNQSAQTMPLPEPYMKGRKEIPGRGKWDIDCGAGPDLYTAEQMHQYARDYAAALSQTAGVADGMVMVQKHDLEWIVAHVLDECDGSGPCADLAARRVRALLAAAPAASGGDISHVTIDFPQVGTAGPFKVIDGRMTLPDVTMNDLIHHARMGCVPASHPPAGASVSERARNLLSAAYRDADMNEHAYNLTHYPRTTTSEQEVALTALEQALTQQRGSLGDAEPSAYFVHRRARSLGDLLFNSMGYSKYREGSWCGHEYDPSDTFTALYATPQPGAEALRELVRRWRDQAAQSYADAEEWDNKEGRDPDERRFLADACRDMAATYRDFADELESLLARGG